MSSWNCNGPGHTVFFTSGTKIKGYTHRGKLLKFDKLVYVVYWHRHLFLPRGRSTIYAIHEYSTLTFIETKQW